jgi:glycosyltransferase involved in cell wall biosynthesis
MGKKYKIAVVWYFDKASEIFPNWKDGFRAAWKEIAKEHEVNWFLDKHYPDPKDNWDFIYLWDDSNSEFFKKMDNYKCRKGISLTTNPQNYDNLKKVDVVFCESTPVYELLRPHGLRTIKAFGTDTEFYSPDLTVEKDIPYFYPATFSPWKRQSEIAYLSNNLLCVGTVQPDGHKELDTCIDAHVQIEIGYFPAKKIRDYYRRAKKVIIPAIHGSERTVLEAMSMNVPVEVTDFHNQKARSYLQEFEASDYESTREFVLANYSEKMFARNLMRGINA